MAISAPGTERAPLFRRALDALVALLSLFLFRRVRRHLAAFRHLARLPSRGPLIVVPNHLSYFDGHVLNYLFVTLFGRRLTTVTNVKAFKGPLQRAYHVLAGDIAVDPSDAEGTYARIGAALEEDAIIVMYPEGHRSNGSGFLPFRHGAFNLSVAYGAPILPVGLRDTHHVLPKGKLRYRRGALARVAFGDVVEPARLRDPALDSRQHAQRLLEHTRDTLHGLVFGPESELFGAEALKREANDLALIARDALERLLDRGVQTLRLRDALRVLRICDLGYLLGVPCQALEVQRLRAIGFLVGALPRLVAPLFLPWFRATIERVLAADPGDPYANYVAGQYHLGVPRLLGGNIDSAVDSMRRAYANAPLRGMSQSRYAIGYATALARTGERSQAIALLERHFAGGPEARTDRLVRRWERANAVLHELRAEPTTQ